MTPEPEASRPVTAAGEQEELQVALRRLLRVTGASFEQRAHLEHALEARVEIEQAKGMLAERLRLPLDDAFELLRQTARSERRSVHDLARQVLERPETPREILARLQVTLERGAGGVTERRRR